MASTVSMKHWMGTILHPPKYFIASIIVSIGGLLNGHVLSLERRRSSEHLAKGSSVLTPE